MLFFSDLDQGHTRLSVYISSFDYHVYNRTKVYEQLNELFGLKSSTEFTKEGVFLIFCCFAALTSLPDLVMC